MAKRLHSGVHVIYSARVLIVEDDPDAAELFAIWMRSAGHRVSVACDARSALELAEALRPSVAVIDIGLPIVDGIQLIGELRELRELERCQYIAVTAYQNVELRACALAAGFAAFFEKPMPREALLESVLAATVPYEHARSV